MKNRSDFKARPARSNHRDTTDLWEIRAGGETVTMVRGEEQALMLCENLNLDPYYLDRGQDRLSRGGEVNYDRGE